MAGEEGKGGVCEKKTTTTSTATTKIGGKIKKRPISFLPARGPSSPPRAPRRGKLKGKKGGKLKGKKGGKRKWKKGGKRKGKNAEEKKGGGTRKDRRRRPKPSRSKPIHFFNFFLFFSFFSLLLPVSSSNFSLESLCFSFSPWDAKVRSIDSL